MGISLSCDFAKTFSLAAQQNSYPLLKRVLLHFESEGEEPTGAFATGINVELKTDPEILKPELWMLDRLEAGQSTRLQQRPIKPDYSLLARLTEELLVKLEFTCTYIDQSGCEQSLHTSIETKVLPSDYWGGESRQPELLAAFVQPNTKAVELIVAKITQLLRETGQQSTIDGYQSNTRERPFLFGSALWSVLFNERLAYVSPPQGWAKTGQRIRPAANIMSRKTAACLDTSVLLASCLENMGLNPIIAMTRTHAFVGFWLIDDCFPVLTNDDPIDLKKRIDAFDVVIFETTLLTNDSPVTFNQAIDHAKNLLTEDKEDEFVMLIDLKQARSRQIKPIGVIDKISTDDENTPLNEAQVVGLGTIPALPPVRAEEQIIEETPETRVDLWQRKLLDLTKRNPLLNVKRSALKLYCPDLARLEDLLADGHEFKFITAEETGLNDSDRSAEDFTMVTGNDLHKNFALQQLDRKTIVANEPAKRLQNKLVELYRKAKNDLEESGTNSLFLSIGMLRWRDTPEAKRDFRAPLILLPIQLIRRSAQAKVIMRQLPDEEPIFNLTLIEMLQNDFDIDLNSLATNLPEDNSGVDVDQIWDRVRNAIKDEKGFIVEETIVLGSFSFKKYLMWKDLKDRTDLLKQNPFVEHLVDRPRDAYQQSSTFVSRTEVDEKINAEEFYAPLNCDSSQMVAVAASTETQDFVLEGPPGTGKSETIANIIAHNIAHGRKVLFVAEKMAALQVVYRRMEKIGLDHLCLELHSNKANKKAVLEQLRAAWQTRESASQSEWKEKARSLKEVRHHLNRYVSELHKEHELGFSARSAMARTVRYKNSHTLRLDWSADLAQAPIQTKDDVERVLTVANNLGIAFSEIEDIDTESFGIVRQTEWSNQWRTEVVRLSSLLFQKINATLTAAQLVCSQLGVPSLDFDESALDSLMKLEELCGLAYGSNIDFALMSGAPQKIEALKQAAPIHREFSKVLDEVGHGISWQTLKKVDWNDLIEERDNARGVFGFFKRRSIKKVLVSAGMSKPKDLSILNKCWIAAGLLDSLDAATECIVEEAWWKGLEATVDEVNRLHTEGNQALKAFQSLVGQFPDQPAAAVGLRKQLVDGKDFLNPGSGFMQAVSTLTEQIKTLKSLIAEAAENRLEIPTAESLAHAATRMKQISEQGEKLNRWCIWQGAKEEASLVGLMSLVNALETKVVSHEAAKENTETAICQWLAPLLVDQSPSLRKFSASSHEETIKIFRDLDQIVSETAAEYISAVSAGSVPNQNGPETPAEYGVLSRELTKKTKHKSVRALVTEMGSSLTNLTPCFMMSPLSVAQFLPADFALFDLIVFDEASQITTWDAVGAIARGRNVIVVGDPKQMPPSNNYGRADIEDSDEGDLESILDQAIAARLPHLRLTGHYRSRHETLIAFSNAHYYENSLTTFPSAETKQTAVSLHRINGVYSRGSKKNNPIEAQKLVEEVVKRLQDMLHGKPLRSIGIVTINSQQQRLVEDRMDEARRKNPELERFFIASDAYDPVFVKNLESVQGDERDIILLSLTYGPVEAGGLTMSMNFGPLNKSGGERRLNVAVTRATTEVLVFASFDSSMIDLSRTQATAVEHLKNYLEFAERGPVALAEYSAANYGTDHFDSDFEMAVATKLRSAGWKVQTQVGVSKFRVDLGIIHPDKPGYYLAGVECDGATYHGSASARDRDRVRQTILENLGWNIVRLWSTDFFKEPEYSMAKVLRELDRLLEADRAKEENENDNQINEEDQNDNQINIDQLLPLQTEEDGLDEQAAKKVELSARASGNSVSLVNLAGGDLAILNCYPKDSYFEEVHRDDLSNLAKDVLKIKNGITLHELALDLANLHGLARTSRKQRQYLRGVIKPWAGFWRDGDEKTTVWLSPTDICDEIAWRGYRAFGVERNWHDLCFQEQVGFAKQALRDAPRNPISWMFEQFEISRRHAKTTETFKIWLERVRDS